MSKHNYSQYSNKSNHNKHKHHNDKPHAPAIHTDMSNVTGVVKVAEYPAANQTPVETTPVVNPAAKPEVKTVEGAVVNCAKLNVREAPSTVAEIVCTLDAMSEIEIDLEKSTADWFKICTATGIEGYCMRKFIDAYL